MTLTSLQEIDDSPEVPYVVEKKKYASLIFEFHFLF